MSTFTKVILETGPDARARFREESMALSEGAPQAGRERPWPVAPYLISSGEISLGRIKAISGQMISATSTSSIGTSMIMVSLSA